MLVNVWEFFGVFLLLLLFPLCLEDWSSLDRADYTAQGFHVIWRIGIELGWKPQEEETRHLTINGRVTNNSLKVK